MKKNNKGFSLVELIIVIAIMAILVAVLAPQYLKYVERSRKSTDCSNVTEIVTALQTYAADPMVSNASGTVSVALAGTGATANGWASDALSAAGLVPANIKLKSSKWSASVVITVTDTSGNFVITATPATATQNIMEGIYE